MFKVQMRKPCTKRRSALCGHYPTARWREAVVHLLATLTRNQLVSTHTDWLFYDRPGRKAWSGDAPNKATKKLRWCHFIISNNFRWATCTSCSPQIFSQRLCRFPATGEVHTHIACFTYCLPESTWKVLIIFMYWYEWCQFSFCDTWTFFFNLKWQQVYLVSLNVTHIYHLFLS